MPPIVSKIREYSSMLFRKTRIAFDIGTSVTRVGIEDKGIVLREPTFVGQNTRNNELIFYGAEAKEIYGKAPGYIKVIKPIENSIISDFDATVYIVEQFLKKSVYPYYARSLIKHGLEAYTTVPTSSTEVEQKALIEALIKAGCHKVNLIERPLAAAYGSGLPIFGHKPIFIIDLGAGSVEATIIIMGGIVASKILKLGGDHMDKLIYNYLHLKYGLIIGEQTSEQLKIKLYNLKDKKDLLPTRGKSLENGLPKSIRVSSNDIQEALSVPLNQIVDGVKELIETAPPEIIDGMIKSGVTITGSLAQIPGIDKYIATEIKIPVNVASKPDDSTILGIMKIMKDDDNLKRIVINKN